MSYTKKGLLYKSSQLVLIFRKYVAWWLALVSYSKKVLGGFLFFAVSAWVFSSTPASSCSPKTCSWWNWLTGDCKVSVGVTGCLFLR